LYAEGDDAAKAAAERFVRAEAEVRRIAARQRGEIAKRSYPTLAHRVGALLEVVDPRIPDQWLEQLIYGPVGTKAGELARRLPQQVREAVDEYLDAKQQLRRLNGRSAPLASAS
jgi:hypothetical protein